ncbi:MAG: ribonuclease P protein component [bacterium]
MKREYSLSAKEIPFIMKDSHKYSCGFFYVRYKDFNDKTESKIPKFAFIASKKDFKKAVQRNYAKRVLKESISPLVKEFSPKAYLFFIQKSVEKADFKDLKKEVEKFLRYLSSN